MVAAAGEKEGLRPAVALTLAAIVILGTIGQIVLSGKISLMEAIGPGKSPEVLAERARQIAASFGYPDEPADRAFGFQIDAQVLDYLRERGNSAAELVKLPSLNPVIFWYRESRKPLHHASVSSPGAFLPGIGVTLADPPPVAGDLSIFLDSNGRLRRFQATVDMTADEAERAPSPDWDYLRAESGLDKFGWTQTNGNTVLPPLSEKRLELEGALSVAKTPVRVQAATYKDRLLYFDVVGPVQPRRTTSQAFNIARVVLLIVFEAVIPACGLLLARHNLRSGRGDRRGANRLSAAFGLLLLVQWLLGEHHIWSSDSEWNLVYLFLGRAIVQTFILWIMYVAVEPFVRRHWPQVLISWSRLISGDYRDPLIGRDMLIGAAAAIVYLGLGQIQNFAPSWFSGKAALNVPNLNLFVTPGTFVATMLNRFGTVVLIFAFGFLVLNVFSRLLLKSDWAGVAIGAVLLTVSNSLAQQNLWTAPVILLSYFVIFFVVMRFGLVTLFAGSAVVVLLGGAFLTFQRSVWYSQYGFAAVAAVAVLTLYAFRTSLGNSRTGIWKILEQQHPSNT
jgi:serine/threonine-protein kinase